MEVTYRDFAKRVRWILDDGALKYGNSYTEYDQSVYIREKLQRFHGEGNKAKNPQDILKIAAYAYLWYKKELEREHPIPYVYAIYSYSGWSAEQLLELGIVDDCEMRHSAKQLDYNLELPRTRNNILLLLGCKFKIPFGFRVKFDEAYNLHPGTLPRFKGKNPHEVAISRGVEYTHATLHKLTAEIDKGEIVQQVRVKVHPDKDVLIERLKMAGVIAVYNFLRERRGL